METSEVDVLIVGAGSAGLVLAIELARRGVNFRLIEKQTQLFNGSRGKGLQPRTIEIFEQLGVIAPLLGASAPYPPVRTYLPGAEPRVVQTPVLAATAAEPYPNSLMIPQWQTEAILRARLAELGQTPELDCELTAFVQDEDGVTATVTLRGAEQAIRARYLVGTDGGRSTVRKLLDIAFPGETRPVRTLIGDLPVGNLSREFWHRWPHAPGGHFGLCPLVGTDLFQMAADIELEDDPDLSEESIRQLIVARSGLNDLVIGTPTWLSIFRVNLRLAENYRCGRVFLAGDAAHVHPPTGGQGLNTSVQDAYNLGWKLAATLNGAPDALLASYEAERRPIAAGVLKLSDGLLAAMTAKHDMHRGRETFQLDLNYRDSVLAAEQRAAPGRVRAGDRAPDAWFETAGGTPCRLFERFAHPGFTLIAYAADAAPLHGVLQAQGVQSVAIGGEGAAYFDVKGQVAAHYDLQGPTFILVRPDGYIAVMAERAEAIARFLEGWSGAPARSPQAALAAAR